MKIKDITLNVNEKEFYELYNSVTKDSLKPQSESFVSLLDKLRELDSRLEFFHAELEDEA